MDETNGGVTIRTAWNYDAHTAWSASSMEVCVPPTF